MTDEFMDSLGKGLKYPWNRPKGLLNIFWVLIPILGWFAIAGYIKKIVTELINGNNQALPEFSGFFANMVDGFWLFVFYIPTLVAVSILGMVPFVGGILNLLVSLFIIPWLVMNYFVKGEFGAFWELSKAFKIVTDNIVEYLIALVKTFVFAIVYGFLSIILIGIPAYVFGSSYFLAEFYNNHR